MMLKIKRHQQSQLHQMIHLKNQILKVATTAIAVAVVVGAVAASHLRME
jgi:hypothetical protein